MADNFDTLSIQITASAGKAINSVNRLADALIKLNGALHGIDASGLESVSKATEKFGQAASNLKITKRRLEKITDAFQQVGQASGTLATPADAMQNLAEMSRAAGQSTESAAQSVGSGAASMQKLANAANNTSVATKKAATNIKKMGGSTLGAAITSKGLAKELTRIGKMLKLMITRMILRKLIQGVVDGFKNLVQYSDKFNATISLLWNSLRQLGNSIAAATSPLLNALAPALNYIIQLLIKAVDAINQFISALMGLGTFTKAKVLTDDYRKSLDKANGSAKELKKTVLGFDELNQLQDNKNSGGGGTSAKDMFEEVPIDPRILKFIDALKKAALGALDTLKKLWKEFKEGFKNGLGDDWKKKVASIIDGATRIKNALKDIFTDPQVTAAADRYYQSLARTLGAIAGTVARIGLNIGVNLSQGIAASLEEKAPRIKDYMVEMFDIGTAMNQQVEQFSYALGNISDVIAGENGIQVTTNLSNIFTEAFMLITENAAKTGQSILELLTQPVIDNQDQISSTFDGLLGTLASITGTIDQAISDIRDTLSDTWDNHIYPIVSSVSEALSDLTGIVLEFWQEYIQPVLDDIAAEFGDVWNEDLAPFFKDFMNILGTVGEFLVYMWKSKIVPFVDFFKTVFGPVIKMALEGVVSSFKFAWNMISLVVGTITKVLSALLTFLKTGFTKGWGEAWEGLKADFVKIWDHMLEKVKDIVNSLVDGINGFINGWIGSINGVISLVNKIPNVSIEPLGGYSPIPHWSTGGFPEDGLFMANHNELVGQFSNGRTAVANNEQITDGIARAVYSALVSANNSGNNQRYINNTIQIDGKTIARAVTVGQDKLNRLYSPTQA